jgi:hypothetical protein
MQRQRYSLPLYNKKPGTTASQAVLIIPKETALASL